MPPSVSHTSNKLNQRTLEFLSSHPISDRNLLLAIPQNTQQNKEHLADLPHECLRALAPVTLGIIRQKKLRDSHRTKSSRRRKERLSREANRHRNNTQFTRSELYEIETYCFVGSPSQQSKGLSSNALSATSHSGRPTLPSLDPLCRALLSGT